MSLPVTNTGRVLVVEDEPDLAALISRHLTAIALSVECVGDGDIGLTRALGEPWDAIVLDVRLPRRDGLAICREVRQHNPAQPILILTALGTELDRVVGLEMGADDYLTKPFGVGELQARVRALLRRARLLHPAERLTSTDALPRCTEARSADAINIGRLCVDRARRRVWFNGQEIVLTRREFDLLWHFSAHPGQVFSRSDLLESVWGIGHDGYDHTVNSHINRLRGKLKRPSQCQVSIVTVWGVGYRLNVSS